MPSLCTGRTAPLLAILATLSLAACDTLTAPRGAPPPAEVRRTPDEPSYDRRMARWLLGNPVPQSLLQGAGSLVALADGRPTTLAAFVVELRARSAAASRSSHCRVTHRLHAIRGDSTTPYPPYQPIPDEGLMLWGAEWPGTFAKPPRAQGCADVEGAALPDAGGPWLHYLPPDDGALGWYGAGGTAHIARVADGVPCDELETHRGREALDEHGADAEFITCRRARFEVRVDAELVARRSLLDSIARETSYLFVERRHTLHVAPTVVPGFVYAIDCAARTAHRAALRAAGTPPAPAVSACGLD